MKNKINLICMISLSLLCSCSTGTNHIEQSNELNQPSKATEDITAREYYFSGELCNYIVDEKTGQKTAVKQNMHPFQFDGTPQTTFYSYDANIVCGYPSEGNIIAFMLQDGILIDIGYQGEMRPILSLPYQNGKRMKADLSVNIPFVTEEKRIALCSYLSDSCFSTDYEEFELHSENISSLFYTYETLNEYPSFNSNQIKQCDSEKTFAEIDFPPQDTLETELPREFVLFSETGKYATQKDSFLLSLSDDTQPVLLYNKPCGNYRAFVLLNDQPIPAFSGTMYLDLNCIEETVNVQPITLPELEEEQIYTLKLVVTDLSTMRPEMACSQLVMRSSK